MGRGRIVAVVLVTQQELDALGASLDRVFRVDEVPCMNDLLVAIDDADREYRRTVQQMPRQR
ncbi:hypothetical protein [Sphingomonas sp. ID0503]|uniref:hypothetical protein n=1 Tax=Sphingomonas sp. ID0503 TaxID=3399691 RepID=UPI003AFA8172